MKRERIIEEVNAVLQSGFEVDPAKITPEAHLYFDLGIDSLDAIDMLVFIEERLGRMVDATLFKNVRKVSDLYDVMEAVVAADEPPGDGLPLPEGQPGPAKSL